jgi:multidrug efflux pump
VILSDVSIRRPVFATVLSLLLIVFGLMAFDRLALREYPDVDSPVVSIDVSYPGAAAVVVENTITQLIEDRIAGIEGMRFVESVSEDGRSVVTIEFEVDRDIDAAANDVRDRVSGILGDLPDEADAPEIRKVDSNEDVIMWLSLSSDRMTVPELSDYARRYLVDRFSTQRGVARARIGGEQIYAMRVWLDRHALAARGLTITEVEDALRAENVELPAGSIDSSSRQFTLRLQRSFQTAEDFARIVIGRGADGYLVRIGDVARVERGTAEDRISFRGNGLPRIGIGIVKQSTANTLEVARAVRAEAERINATLPEGMSITSSYDSSVFIEGAVHEVYWTMAVAIAMVILVIYLFLGSARATLVPAVTVPVSLIATFTVLYALGFSVNILTLLALILAIGLVVDDAIVVLENIHRRMEQYRETRLVAAFRGTRQVGFAVIATTVVLIAVFVPIGFLQGDVGRLFQEFAITLAAAVAVSAVVALSLSPMIASRILQPPERSGPAHWVDVLFAFARRGYRYTLLGSLRHAWLPLIVLGLVIASALWLLREIPQEYLPSEDRGAFFVRVEAPEGSSYEYLRTHMDEIERRLLPYVESGEATQLLVRAPAAFGNAEIFNVGNATVVLDEWDKRRPARQIMDEIDRELAQLPGVRVSVIMRQGFQPRTRKPVQFVLGGGSYEQLAEWRDILLDRIAENNPGLQAIGWDYNETKPQIGITIDYDRAADLGVTVDSIGRTLETMLASRRVTTYIDQGEEYDVILEGERELQRTRTDLENIYVRSRQSGALVPLASLVQLDEFADAQRLNRFDRVRAITIDANLASGLSLGDALDYLDALAREHLPESVVISYKGQSRDFRSSSESMLFVFLLGFVVVFLVLAALFESWIHPLVIILTVPFAMAGALAGLYAFGLTLNIFSQIALIMLVGLSAKNGILIVEFTNQLRDAGRPFREALLEAAELRLRPIVMTGLTTAAGALPLILSSGAGAETRLVVGVVIICGTLAATFFTLYMVPVAYALIARRTGSPQRVSRQLEAELERQPPPPASPHDPS